MIGASFGHDQDVARLPAGPASKLLVVGGALAAVGVALSVAAAFADPARFAHAWLTGFEYVLTIGLGALLFVLIQHVTRAGWSVAAGSTAAAESSGVASEDSLDLLQPGPPIATAIARVNRTLRSRFIGILSSWIR